MFGKHFMFVNDDIRDFTRHYMIKFDVDATPDIMKWRYEY